ncbi:hypothetical protein VNO80_25178 [Phaseolus coccineus]|uniref:Uncharacterized protein n=1 Tax=Phaseolus coccineus TaxID=3886 RepID=A0AAN9LXC4_PHACN
MQKKILKVGVLGGVNVRRRGSGGAVEGSGGARRKREHGKWKNGILFENEFCTEEGKERKGRVLCLCLILCVALDAIHFPHC